jgi:hypothetical protein
MEKKKKYLAYEARLLPLGNVRGLPLDSMMAFFNVVEFILSRSF